MMKAAFALTVLFLFTSIGLWANPSVTIQLYDVQIYFPHSAIYVEVTITNTESDSIKFKMAENRMFNLSFLVRNIDGTPLEPSTELITRRMTDQVYFRDLSLEPGESLSFIEPLHDFITLPGSGTYLLTTEFYPDLYRSQNRLIISSNTLRITVRPGGDEISELIAEVDQATAEILEMTDIGPDEVVRYTIEARQQSNWNRFFLYLDLTALLRQSPSRNRRYQASSEADRERMREQYRKDLQSGQIDPEISFIPHEFEIQRVEFGPRKGNVVVQMIFDQGSFRELKQYTYELEKSDYWKIVSYSVHNLGTEAIR